MWHHSFIYLPIKVVIFIILKGSEASVAVGSEGQENYMCVIQLRVHTAHPSGLNLIFVLWRSVLRRQRSWPVFALTPHSDTHLSTPLWFSQNQKPPCLSDSEDTVPLTGPNDIDRSVKTGKEHTGGRGGQNRHQKRFYFLKTLRTSGDLKPSGTVIECEGQWIPQMCTWQTNRWKQTPFHATDHLCVLEPKEVKKKNLSQLYINTCCVCDSGNFSLISQTHTCTKKTKS